jgi:hypothetical protein
MSRCTQEVSNPRSPNARDRGHPREKRSAVPTGLGGLFVGEPGADAPGYFRASLRETVEWEAGGMSRCTQGISQTPVPECEGPGAPAREAIGRPYGTWWFIRRRTRG